MKKFEIAYRLIKFSNTPQQKTIIVASDPGAARRIFQQQNPGCVIIGSPHEIK